MITVEERIESQTRELAARMRAKAQRLEAGEAVELVEWVIPSTLGCMQRPLRHHPRFGGSGAPIPPSASELVHEWVEQVRMEGVAAIISFMHDRDLKCYRELDLGTADFTSFLRTRGFAIASLPWEDPHHKKTTFEAKRKKLLQMRQAALEAFDLLPKPVVVMCSAGIDRSSPAAAFIREKRLLPAAV